VCCFNRHAASELRRRLSELAGADARGVTVLTYHALAMRLLGRSYSARADAREPLLDFDALIADAVRLLKGEQVPSGLEADEVRDRLLAGFQHILVDEYQDIDQPQYELISALAGRTLQDPDLKLSILAVGDDDQNIYAFRGANVEFIRRFQEDYDAGIHFLVENYRSTRYIIEAANDLIAANSDRMKTGYPIRIDRHRELHPPGGEFGQRDDLTRGRVQVVRVRDEVAQAHAVLAELQRLQSLGVADGATVAVLSSIHRDLARFRALAERESIPIQWLAGRAALPPLHQVREVRGFLLQLAGCRHAFLRAADLNRMADELFEPDSRNPWIRFLRHLLDAWHCESADAEAPVQDAIEFLYEACAESRREFHCGDGVALGTVHSAKGTEYHHVLLIGPWPLKPERAWQEEDRRAFYVGMTRARKTLSVFDRLDVQPSLPGTLTGPAVWHREGQSTPPSEDAIHAVNYVSLGLDDVHLGYPGRFPEGHPIHAALDRLQPGDKLHPRRESNGDIELQDREGTNIARLSQKAAAEWAGRIECIREVRVLAMVHRSSDQDPDAMRRESYLVSHWEVPVVEVVFQEEESRIAPSVDV
jgi:ATP-dependent DNA helicase RecQ